MCDYLSSSTTAVSFDFSGHGVHLRKLIDGLTYVEYIKFSRMILGHYTEDKEEFVEYFDGCYYEEFERKLSPGE